MKIIFLKSLLVIFVSFFLFICSFFVVRVNIQKPIKNINGETISFLDLPDKYSISFYHVSGGENLRGFPFSMISSPYTHNSTPVSEFNIIYNLIFYIILITIGNFIYFKVKKGK